MEIGQSRCLLGLFLALFWSVASFPLPAVNAQAQKIRISLSSRSNTNATYYVAQGKGFFKDEGLEVEFIQVNPRLGAMAVLNGDVTFTTSFVSPFAASCRDCR
jgi:ABC-type nitrate/sulfonate/bicarbonate transport system substrate-binding protein